MSCLWKFIKRGNRFYVNKRGK